VLLPVLPLLTPVAEAACGGVPQLFAGSWVNGGPGNTGWTLSTGTQAHIQRWVLPSDIDGCTVNFRYAATAANMHFPAGYFYEVGAELYKRSNPSSTFFQYSLVRETVIAHVVTNNDHALPTASGCLTPNNSAYTGYTVKQLYPSTGWYYGGYDCSNGNGINWDSGGTYAINVGQTWGYTTTETERFATATSYRPTNTGLAYWDGGGGLHAWPGVHCWYDTDPSMYINPYGNSAWWPNAGSDPPGYLCDQVNLP
jgi:hypothetical protein